MVVFKKTPATNLTKQTCLGCCYDSPSRTRTGTGYYCSYGGRKNNLSHEYIKVRNSSLASIPFDLNVFPMKELQTAKGTKRVTLDRFFSLTTSKLEVLTHTFWSRQVGRTREYLFRITTYNSFWIIKERKKRRKKKKKERKESVIFCLGFLC